MSSLRTEDTGHGRTLMKSSLLARCGPYFCSFLEPPVLVMEAVIVFGRRVNQLPFAGIMRSQCIRPEKFERRSRLLLITQGYVVSRFPKYSI